MNKYIKKTQYIVCRLVLKIKIICQCLFKKKQVKDYTKAIELLNSKSYDCKTSCIRNNDESKICNYQLSIIIPAYNCENSVERCINSVLSQNLKYTYEIIVINDGSTDNTKDVLNKFKNIDNIHIIEQKNKGYSGARNAGIDFATGSYLMFLDSDDEMLPNGINALLDRAYEYNADIVEGGFRYIYPNGNYSDNPSSEVIKEIFFPLGILEGYFWGKVYKRKILNGIRLPEGYWFEDSLNAHILFWRCKKSIIVPELVYGYYKNENGITQTAQKKLKSIDSLYITESLLKDHLEMGFNINQDYYEYFLRMVRLTYYRTREMEEEVRNSIFLSQCHLYENYFSSFSTGVIEMLKLESSLKTQNYKTYVYCMELK